MTEPAAGHNKTGHSGPKEDSTPRRGSDAKPADARLLRLVLRVAADPERFADARVSEVPDHAVGRVLEIVTVVDPDARIVGDEGDLIGLTGRDLERVGPPWASRRLDPVVAQHHRVMAVQVHRMTVAAGVLDPQPR